jgi:hypothetical protein
MTELTNINNIMDISISGYQFSNWITKFKKNYKQSDGNYDYMSYLLSLNNPSSFYLIAGRIGEEEGNIFLNKLLTSSINNITVIGKKSQMESQMGGGGGLLIFILLVVLFIGNINISKNILESEITILNIITEIAKNIFKDSFSYKDEIELEWLKQNIILYGFGAIAGIFVLHLYFKNEKNIQIAEWLYGSEKLKPDIATLIDKGEIIKIDTKTGIKYFTSVDNLDYLVRVYNNILESDAIEYRKNIKGHFIDNMTSNERSLYYPTFADISKYPKAPFAQKYPPRLKDKEDHEWWEKGKWN